MNSLELVSRLCFFNTKSFLKIYNYFFKPNKYSDDLLFWMFYSNPNDKMQLLAAEQLFERNWKFHKEEKIWISRTRNIEVEILLEKKIK